MPKRKRRLKVKWKNVFKLLSVILVIIFAFKGISYLYFNNKVFNDIKGSKLTIKTNKKQIKLSKKNVEYINSSNVKVKIKSKKLTYNLKNEYINNITNLKIHLYKDKIKEDGFNNSKGYFISDDKIKTGNVTVKLPFFLSHKKVVDVYGVKGNDYIKEYTKKVKNKQITFKYNSDYDRYVITYVKLKEIRVDSEQINMVKNRTRKILINIIPAKATNNKIKYIDVDKKYISIKNNIIKSKKDGKTSFIIKVDNKKIKMFVNITSKKFDVTKVNGIYYVDGLMLVNKSYPIREDYNPGELNEETKTAFAKLQNDAYAEGINVWIVSGFRSYSKQKELYDDYVSKEGQEKADTYSARPGYSEHQTGYAFDVNEATDKFNNTKEAKWLEKNAHKYGFILRFPKNKEDSTGYKYESWHLRYVGKDKAILIHNSGLSLEEYYGINSKYKD